MSEPSRQPKEDAVGERETPATPAGEDLHDAWHPDRWWFGLPGIAWALALSVVFHLLVALPFMIWEFAPTSAGLEARWLERFEELDGIGHGQSAGRWAELEASAPQEEADEDEAGDDEPALDEADDETEEEPAEAEAPEAEPERAVDEQPPAEPSAADKAAPRAEDEPDKEPKEAAKSAEKRGKSEVFAADKPLPGQGRAGPSNIPDLKHYGPGNARVTALVRLDRVRGTIYEDSVRQIMKKVPDFRLLAEYTDFDPVSDIDAFFMASARPQYLQESFLAVRHGHSQEEIKAVLDARFRDPIAWESRGGAPIRRLVPESSRYQDPRRVLLAESGLTIVGKEAWLEEIAQNLAEDSPLRGEAAQESAAAPQATMLDGLAQIERVAEAEDTLAVLSAQGLVYMLPGLGRMTFEGVRLKLANPAAPTLDLDLKFESAEEARRFNDSCPSLRARLKKGLRLDGLAGVAMRAVGLGDIIDNLQCRAEDEYVNVHGAFTAQQLRSIAGLAAPLVPRPRALSQLPPPPPPPAVDEDEDD